MIVMFIRVDCKGGKLDMITAETDPLLVSGMRESDLESIVEWFAQHKKSLYTLCWSYLNNQQVMEEAFHRSIVQVYDGLQRFKKDTSFESWVTSIFINNCRDLSNKNLKNSLQVSKEIKENEQTHAIFNALAQLKDLEKAAIVLTYINELPLEESALILKLPVDTVKSHLFYGIKLLREELGYGKYFDGCKEYHKHYIDYLGRTLNRPEKVDFEIHIFHCQDCQNDLSSFQDVILSLLRVKEDVNLPSGFMEKVKDRVAETAKNRRMRKKKRKSIGLVFASILTLIICIGFVTNSFANIYYSWVDWRNHEDEQLRAFLKNDLGERLNMEEVSNGVKVKIKSAVADDVQTLIYYEIEDTNQENRYMMNPYEGVGIENEFDVMSREAQPRYSPPVLQKEVQNEKKNVYKGTLSLLPISADNGTIELKISKLQKLVQDPSKGAAYDDLEFTEGNWNFDIPVTKHPSIVHQLDNEVELDGIPIRLDKLTIAPTATILHFSYQNQIAEKQVNMISFDSLETKNKKVKADPFGGNMYMDSYQPRGWNSGQASFESLYFEDPKEVSIQFGSIRLSVENKKEIDIDVSKDFPQTFEYAGSTISIDKVKVGKPTEMVMTYDATENRVFETLQFQILGENEQEIVSMGMNGDGVIMDKKGNIYNPNEVQFPFENLDHPRYFETKRSIELFNDNSGGQIIPKKLEIQGYNTTKYIDEAVKVSLD